MRKNLILFILIIGAIYGSKAQTQTQDLNMGLHQLQFPSANGGFNRIHSFGGTFPGKWLFKSRFDDIYLDAGENSGNRYRILFLSGGIERARINGDGKFGIGTANPTEKLHVEGSLLLDAYQSGNQRGLFFREGFSTTNKYNLSILTYDDGDNSPDALDINAYDGIYFNTGSNSRNPRMTIKGNGNVGIGTTNPTAKLYVVGNLNTTDHINANQYISVSKGGSARVAMNGQGHGYITGRNDSVENKFLIHSNGSSWFNGGNVGIGTTNPTNLLTLEKNQNGSTFIEVNNSNSGNSARRGITIGNGTPGNSVYLLSTSPNYNQVNTWANAGVLATDSQLSNGLILRSASGKIRFQPNGISDKIVFDQNGNVGIGTTNPEGKLQVKDLNTTPIVNITGKAPNTGNDELVSEIRLSNLYDNLPGHRASIKAISDKSGSHGNVAFQFSTSLWDGNHSEINALRIASDGNVGIGTTNPDAKLRVQGTHSLGRFYTDTDGRFEIQATRSSSTALNSDLVLSSQQHIVLDPNRHGTTGNVGIGTYTPDAKLAVNGNIHTKEVKVDLVGWPDYVFEEDYHLPTLQEVEQHITEKGHLENIPSAAEVAENGVQLGEMNKKLLEKIEQLTLYMIEQNKKTDLLLNEVEALKKKNAALEARLK
ncbi:hypothetical protein [Aquimarina litoralis]|uniref:hypothetical protein n=1 Tax=Aquimarina litoralis TaxID=584605 RepID=UPI001C582B14|nr:hypothetical protein [Aquimarina litoralis]MBW1294866.1 hypothetical protein [Aquimarina litoralis]